MLPSAQRQYEEQEAMKLATGEGGDDIMNTPLMEAVIQKYLNENSKQNVSRSLTRLVLRFPAAAEQTGNEGIKVQQIFKKQDVKLKGHSEDYYPPKAWSQSRGR